MEIHHRDIIIILEIRTIITIITTPKEITIMESSKNKCNFN